MTFFAAYPSSPDHISQSLEAAEKRNSSHIQYKTWRSTFGPGKVIDQSILPEIELADGLLCDISFPNENVFFEIGYAIGLQKPIIPLVNTSLNNSGNYLRKLGILDNVGQLRYDNSEDLIYKLQSYAKPSALFAEKEFDISKQPLFVLDSLRRNEVSNRLISTVKEIIKFYRTFDPQEEYRLSVRNAWELINESSGVVVTIHDNTRADYELHNIRAAFLAGLAIGRKKECLILVDPDAVKPLDYVDICRTIKHPEQITDAIESMVPKLYQIQLARNEGTNRKRKSLLANISVGANAAENEMKALEQYFVETHDFKNALEGRGRLIVGRKGSGKTAIFWRVRDIARKNSNKELVVDLKPDGYQLQKFKEQLVSLLAEGTKAHTLTAFWEYIIFGEILHKIFEYDYGKFYGRDRELSEILDLLSPLKSSIFQAREGDFSERMIGLIREVNERFKQKHGFGEQVSLQTEQVTELLYSTDIRQLQTNVVRYLSTRERCIILIDNIDKGWGSHGVEPDDVLIVSTLIDALRKIERHVGRNNGHIDWLFFLRNDVFELLVDQQNDRGKDGKILVDWDSEAALRQVIEERIKSSSLARTDKSAKWTDVAVAAIDEQESLSWLISRCLMRPRYLIQLCDECIGHAHSSGNLKIGENDLRNGLKHYSQDIVGNTNYEMRDILPISEDAIYSLIGQKRKLTLGDVKLALMVDGFEDKIDEIIELFFWFAVIGANSPNDEEKYIYDYRYDKKLFSKIRSTQLEDNEIIYINPAFAVGLDCKHLI